MSIDLPSYPNFTTCRFGLETNTQTFTSPLTKATQRVKLGGARWSATYSLPAMNRTQAGAWKAFFLLLEGSANTFNAFDPDCKTPRGAATGTPLVNGGSQTGSSLITDGWTHSVLVLKAGDYFSVNGELKMVTADVSSDGSGNATINFKPALRTSPADNAALTVQKPTCTMILADDMQGVWECDKNGIYQPKTFSAYEVFS
jgi:type 1 fimbria pilin